MRERQKATRRLKQAEKAYKENLSEDNRQAVEKYTLDLYYTMHYPLTEKYIALYPKSSTPDQELEKQTRIRNELMKEMLERKKMTSGSNQVELGVRKSLALDPEDAAEVDGREIESDLSDDEIVGSEDDSEADSI